MHTMLVKNDSYSPANNKPNKSDQKLESMNAKIKKMTKDVDKLKGGQSGDQKEVTKKRLPEAEWLAKQTCHKCKQKGHLKKNCPKLAGQANSAMTEVADTSST